MKRKWGIWILICLLSLANTQVGWSRYYDNKPSFCAYEIDMNWEKADMKNSAAYKAGAIDYSSGSTSDKAIIIKSSTSFWVHGKNIDDYYRIMITNDADPTLYFDDVSITHGEKVPIWIKSYSNVTIKLIGRSSLQANGSGDYGIEMTDSRSRLTIENYINNGSLNVNSSQSYAINGGHLTITSGKLEISNYSVSQGLRAGNFIMTGGELVTQRPVYFTGDATISDGAVNVTSFFATTLKMNSGKLSTTSSLTGYTLSMSGGEIDARASAGTNALNYYTSMTINGGLIKAQGTDGIYTPNLNVYGGEIQATGSRNDLSSNTMNQTGGYISLNGTSRGLSAGTATFSGGTLVTTQQHPNQISCNRFQVIGGSVIINTPDGNAAITNGSYSVYRVKVRGLGLNNNQEYACVVNGYSFNTRLINGYFHFWLPVTVRSVRVNNMDIPIDQVTEENMSTWYEDNQDSKRRNSAPMVVKEMNGTTLVNRYFDFPTAFSGVTAGNKLSVHYTHSLLCNQTLTSTKNSTFNFNGYTLSGTGKISVTGGLLTLTDESTGTKGGTTMPVEATSTGNIRMKEVANVPKIDNLTIDRKVWWGQVTGQNWQNIENVTQGSNTLTKNRHFFSDADGSLYCWLDNTTNNIAFNAGSAPAKYYYTTNPDPTKKHGQVLTGAPYRAYIGTTTKTWYKSLTDAFNNARDKETICLADDVTGESAALKTTAGEVTLDLQTFLLNGTNLLKANGSRLILTATNSNTSNVKFTGITNLDGLVYTDLTPAQLGGGIKRNGNTVYRYYAHKMLVNNRVFYAWNKNQQADEAMIYNGKACLWLPAGSEASGTVSLGYSRDMTKDKCGELLNVPGISAHATNAELVHPVLSIKHSDVQLGNGASSKLSVTHKGVTVNDFNADQQVVVYGEGSNSIKVAQDATIQKLTLRDLNIKHTGANTTAPIEIPANATLNLYLSGKNTLRGGGASNTVKAGINVAPTGTLHVYNDADGSGQLYAKGGAYLQQSGAGIGGNNDQMAGTIHIHGGTIQAEGGLSDHWGMGNGKEAPADNYPEIRIEAGSVRTNRHWEGETLKQSFLKNIDKNGDQELYLMTVNTSLSPNKKYNCTYYGIDEPFPAITDELGKYYFWIPRRTQLDKPIAEFIDPATQNRYTVQLVKVDPNDLNVAPIVCELIIENQPSVYHNSLKDAFDAVATGQTATIKVLTDIDNLSTLQDVKAGSNITLDLDRFNLDTKNSNVAGFNVQLGGYLYITGRGTGGTGNIKSTFRISGDLFIDGSVPLTDATPKLDDKAMFRTLIKGLPGGEKTTYTYSYGTISNRSFNLHDGLACLWLPDANGELTFRVTQGNNVTDYTAGSLSTNVQRTDPIPASPVGVVARLRMQDGSVRDFNSLEDAFQAAASGTGNTVMLLANISLTKNLSIPAGADFQVDLNGMSLTANGAVITLTENASLTVADGSSGTKGQLKCDWIADGQLFVASNVNINISSLVTRSNNSTLPLYRTIAGVGNLMPLPSSVTCGGITSKVIDKEACFWLPKQTGVELVFTLDVGDPKTITGVNINNNHQDNMLTLGVGNDEAAIDGTQYATFVEAWNAAQNGDRIELLKDAAVGDVLTLAGSKTVTVDLVRYSLNVATGGTNPGLAVENGSTLIVTSANGNGRMQVPVQNSGILFVDLSVQADRLTDKITNAVGETVRRTLVNNLPQGMPDEAVFDYVYGTGPTQQSGSFYVKNGMACLWLKVANSQKLTFPQFGSSTDNVTVEPNHANLVIWGQNNVAQVQSSLYTSLAKAFTENSNQTVILLKSAVLEKQTINSEMQLKMASYSISPATNTECLFDIQKGGSLRVSGTGAISVNFQIDFSSPIPGSNANLVIVPEVNIDKATVMSGTTTYYRTSVTLPQDVSGDMTYTYGNRNSGSVKAVANEPLSLWLNVPEGQDAYDFKLTGADGKTYLASNVRIISTHVNPITVQLITDEAYIYRPNGSSTYYKTLAEALRTATAGQTVKLGRDLPAVTGDLKISVAGNQVVTLDLDKHTLSAEKNVTLDAADGQLIVENGTLKGGLTVNKNVFADASADMNGLMVSDASQKTVWRTLLTLPAGTTEFEYKWIDDLNPEGGYTKCTNIHNNVACLWLPSSNQVRTLVVKAGDREYSLGNVIVASTHGNELDFGAGSEPVAKITATGKTYASLASALAEAADGGIVTLLKDLSLTSIQEVKGKSLTLNLAAFSFTSGNSGFSVEAGKTLSITNGMLLGTLRLQGDGNVSADKTVKIGGFVFNQSSKEVYRTLVKVNGTEQCHWLSTAPIEYDLKISSGSGSDIYEASVPAGLADHNSVLTAYKMVTISSGGNWNGTEHTDRNIIVPATVTWTIPEGTAGTIHRLTIHDGGRVVAIGQVTATEGIRYVRTFTTANRWESISLPYNSARIMTIDDATGQPTLRVPATGSGTAGDFWLNTMQANGQQQTVNSTELSANEAYIMAVPTGLKSTPIYFVSGPNQLLRKNAVLAVKPQSGFAAYGNGTLADVEIKEKCYILTETANGMVYKRQDALPYKLAPFRGYLLADLATTENTSELRAGIPTGIPDIVPGTRSLHLYTSPGYLKVNSPDYRTLPIYTIEGRLVTVMRLVPGDNRIALATGFYAVYRQVVRIP